MRTIKIREWTNRHGQAGWQFSCGRDRNGHLEQWRLDLEKFPTKEAAQPVVEAIEKYWREWNQRGLESWTHDHKVLAQAAAGIWPVPKNPNLPDILERFHVELLDKARWRVQQEQKAREAAQENANQWGDHARRQAIQAVEISSQVSKYGVHYVVNINLYLLNPRPATMQVSLFAPIPKDS